MAVPAKTHTAAHTSAHTAAHTAAPAATIALRRFLCKACGLIYDEALGDPDSGLAPGTRFEDIPEDWMCPICGVGKGEFELCAPPKPRTGQGLAFTADVPLAAPRSFAARREKPVVIAGAGVAGWAVAQTLRDFGYEGRIVMMSGDRADRYHKPQISVACVAGKSPDDLVTESASVAASRLQVSVMSGCWISGISPVAHMVRTSRGSFNYARLILALGAQPRRLPEALARYCWQINQLEDYRRLLLTLSAQSSARSNSQTETQGEPQKEPRSKLLSIVMIGGGLVGVELADDLAHLGHRLTVLEVEDRPLAQLASPGQSQAILEGLRRGGVNVRLKVKVRDIECLGVSGYSLNLASSIDGAILPSIHADLVIAAIGLETDPRLARQSGLRFEHGYAVDPATMQTSAPDVYALGDCASVNGQVQRFIEPIQRQALAITSHILGQTTTPFEPRAVPVRLKSRSVPMTLQP